MMTSGLKAWTETRIYERIIEGADSRLPRFSESRRALDNSMGRIQAVLQQGDTAATDFTLHDDQHGFRVAERMVEIIPADVFAELSAYELAHLLFAAYLHDIGMTPERHRVTVRIR
jgi:HD-GYP domain-containing protein (c-di-GMP phosphodiesterase class II)